MPTTTQDLNGIAIRVRELVTFPAIRAQFDRWRDDDHAEGKQRRERERAALERGETPANEPDTVAHRAVMLGALADALGDDIRDTHKAPRVFDDDPDMMRSMPYFAMRQSWKSRIHSGPWLDDLDISLTIARECLAMVEAELRRLELLEPDGQPTPEAADGWSSVVLTGDNVRDLFRCDPRIACANFPELVRKHERMKGYQVNLSTMDEFQRQRLEKILKPAARSTSQ